MLIGTPAYMSPEQAALSSVDLDTRTDIYSLEMERRGEIGHSGFRRAPELQELLEALYNLQNKSGSKHLTVIPSTFLRVTVDV